MSSCVFASISRFRIFSAPAIAGMVRLLLDLGLGRGELALTLLDAGRFAFGDDLVRTRVRLVEDLRRLVARIRDDLLGFRLGRLERLLALVGRRETFGDFLLPFLDGL